MTALISHPCLPHWCGAGHCTANVPAKENPFCGSRHPSQDDTSCMRLKAHGGVHGAFVFDISRPEEWA